MMNNRILLPVFGFFILLTVLSLNIPFFWDSTFFSALALQFYDHGFNGFIASETNDTGGFPLYSAYLAIVWKCFGKSLMVSHFAMLPFLLGIAFEYYTFAKRFLDPGTLFFAILLLLIEPVLLTQSLLMGYDIIIAYFFLLCLNSLSADKKILYSIALILLCMISIRGIMLASALFIIDLLMHRKLTIGFLKNYFPALIIVLSWGIYHAQQTGWYLFSPARENDTEQFTDPAMMLRQVIYIAWKNIDLGRFTLWAFFAIGSIYLFRKKSPLQLKELLRIILIPLLLLTLFMLLIKNPIGHKYFLVVFILLNVGACYLLEQIENKKIKYILFSLIAISLAAGNFIQYPQRFGNAWDSSLKIIPYFTLKEEMDNYVKTNRIDPVEIGTQFPLTQNTQVAILSDHSYSYTDIEQKPMNELKYFLYSNVINSNRMKEIEAIKKNWTEEKKISRGQITLTLYKNPDL